MGFAASGWFGAIACGLVLFKWVLTVLSCVYVAGFGLFIDCVSVDGLFWLV